MNTQAGRFLITPDLSEAAESSGPTPGIYSARVMGIDLKDAKSGGQYFRWDLVIFGAEGELSRWNNWKVNYNTMTSGKGAGMLKSFVKACTGNELTGAFDFATLIGSEVQITIVDGKKQDGTPSGYPEVKSVKQITH